MLTYTNISVLNYCQQLGVAKHAAKHGLIFIQRKLYYFLAHNTGIMLIFSAKVPYLREIQFN